MNLSRTDLSRMSTVPMNANTANTSISELSRTTTVLFGGQKSSFVLRGSQILNQAIDHLEGVSAAAIARQGNGDIQLNIEPEMIPALKAILQDSFSCDLTRGNMRGVYVLRDDQSQERVNVSLARSGGGYRAC